MHTEGKRNMAILSSFLTYLLIAVVLAAVAVAGIFLGKYLRGRKDTKDSVGRKDSE